MRKQYLIGLVAVVTGVTAFADVATTTLRALIASSITGVPGLRPRNIVFRDLNFTVRGGGTRRASSRPVPEREKNYPENRMFGTMLPAYGFYVRHADDIRFENVRLRYTGEIEERPPIVQDDTTGVVIDRCTFR